MSRTIPPNLLLVWLLFAALLCATFGWVAVGHKAYSGQLFNEHETEEYKKLKERTIFASNAYGTLWPKSEGKLKQLREEQRPTIPKDSWRTGRMFTRLYSSLSDLCCSVKLVPGDVVELINAGYGRAGHHMLYVGDGRFLHIRTRDYWRLGYKNYWVAEEGIQSLMSYLGDFNARVNNNILALHDFYTADLIVKRANAEVSDSYLYFTMEANNCHMLVWWCVNGVHENTVFKTESSKNDSLKKGYFEELMTLFVEVRANILIRTESNDEGREVTHGEITSPGEMHAIAEPYIWINDITGDALAVSHKSFELDSARGVALDRKYMSEVRRQNFVMYGMEGIFAAKIAIGPKYHSMVAEKDAKNHLLIGKNLEHGLWIVVGVNPNQLDTYYLSYKELKEKASSHTALVLDLDCSDASHHHIVKDEFVPLSKTYYHGVFYRYEPLYKKMDHVHIDNHRKSEVLPTLFLTNDKNEKGNLTGEWCSTLKEMLEKGRAPQHGDLIEIELKYGPKSRELHHYETHFVRSNFAVYADGERFRQPPNQGATEGVRSRHQLVHFHLHYLDENRHCSEYRIGVKSFEDALSGYQHIAAKMEGQLRFRVNNSYKAATSKKEGGHLLPYFGPDQIVDRALDEVSDMPIYMYTSTEVLDDYYEEGGYIEISVCHALALWCATGRYI